MNPPFRSDLEHPLPPASDDLAPQRSAGRAPAWVELLRTPLPHLSLETFAQLHPVRVDRADGVTLLRIEPTREVKRALAPWTRSFGTTVPLFTSLDAEAGELLDAPQEAARWLQARALLCCAVPVLDDLLIAARAMAAQSASAALMHAAQEMGYHAAELVIGASHDWPAAQIPWADVKNRPTLRLVAQAIELALSARDHERALAWMRWMLARDPQDPHGWRSVMESLPGRDESRA